MKIGLNTTTGKALATAGIIAAAAGVAGLGTFGSFTSTTSASTNVATGTVNIALGTAGTVANRLTIGAAGLVPGDTVARAVTLTNTGSQNLSSVSLTTAAAPSSKLDTDAVNGLQVQIDACSVPWTEAGTAPAYTYTCSGTKTAVVAPRAVIGSNVALPGLAALTATKSDNLVVTLSLPNSADNTFQGLSSTIGFTFTGTQRAGTNQ